MAAEDPLTADECATWLTSADARYAFRYLLEFGAKLRGYKCYLHRHGYLRTYRYETGGDRPYAFIVNRTSLLFYFRRAGMQNPAANLPKLARHFDDVLANNRGEIQLRIVNEEQARQLMGLIFGRS